MLFTFIFEYIGNKTLYSISWLYPTYLILDLITDEYELNKNFFACINLASASAKDFVEKLGGSITIIEKKKLALKLSKKAGV